MKTILVVDDEFGITEALSALLSDEGYRVFTSPNGKRGLEKVEEVNPQLVIIDFMMPVLSGDRMIATLRKTQAYKSLPIILMSGVAESAVRRDCDGYDAFLRKPFNAKALLKLVRALLESSKRP